MVGVLLIKILSLYIIRSFTYEKLCVFPAFSIVVLIVSRGKEPRMFHRHAWVFFSDFLFFVCEKIPNHVHRTFVEYFFPEKKKVEKIFHSSTMNIHGFFFQGFFFSLKKNTQTCLVFFHLFF